MKRIVILFLCFNLFLVAQATVEQFKKHVEFLASDELEGRGLGTAGKEKAKEYIKEEFLAAALKPYFGDSFFQAFPFKYGISWINATNVAGFIEGSDPQLKHEFVIIGAHYDHVGYELKDDQKVIYNGADDNASGVAMLIELAKTFAKNPEKPKRSILFIAFDAEESGLKGAYHFVKSLENDQLKNIKKMFSLDMVGMLKANNSLELKGITQLSQGKDIVTKSSEKHQITLSKVNNQLENRTDTYPFGIKGIPSTHVFTGLKSPYHKPEDDADLLDYDGMKTIHHFLVDVLNDLTNEKSLNAIAGLEKISSSPKKVVKPFKFGIVANLGQGHHLYKDEFYNAKESFSYGGGLALNVKMNKYFSLNLETLYDHNSSQSSNGTFSRQSVTVPLQIEFGSNSSFDQRVFVFAGAFFRHNFAGKDGKNTLDFDNIYQPNEWGYTLGFGLDLGKMRITFGNRTAFHSIFQNKNIADVRARNSFVGLTYQF